MILAEYTMQWIEQTVCECVSAVMEEMQRDTISIDDLYKGKKNIPLARSIARNVIFDTFHNKYGFSYAVIAQRADMERNSVIRCVKKCHNYKHCDAIYGKVFSLLDERFKEKYDEYE